MATRSAARGDWADLARLMPGVYGELRKVAHRHLRGERDGHTLSTTALVHEAFLKLADQQKLPPTRAQFFALAARAMRRILVDYARRHGALRRGGGYRRVSLADDRIGVAAAERADDLVALDEALDRLAVLDARLGLVVELRFFAGLTEAEIAKLLRVTPRTVARDWVKAKGWLYRELRSDV
jgi:RNA polymerase sigma factor (TIGR02999 family)